MGCCLPVVWNAVIPSSHYGAGGLPGQDTCGSPRPAPPRSEFGMPPDPEVATRIAIAPAGFKTWEDIAHWYAEVVGKRNIGGVTLKRWQTP